MASVLKRPMNNLVNPVYPVIHKAAPQFKDARKNNVVDAGRVLMELEHHPEMTTYPVLVQSRDRNRQHQYGQSSHRSVVNKEFRPAGVDQILDNLPLNRIPVKAATIMPGAINQGNAETYVSNNNDVSNVSKHITDDIKGDQGWRTNIEYPFEKPLEHVNVSLNPKIINYVSVTSGMTTPFDTTNPASSLTKLAQITLDDKLTASASAGFTTQYTTPIYTYNSEATLDEEKIVPYIQAGFVSQFQASADDFTPSSAALEDEKLNPILQSWQTTTYVRNGETQLERLELTKKTTAGALSAGTTATRKMTQDEMNLSGTPSNAINCKKINYSANASKEIPIKKMSALDTYIKLNKAPKGATGMYTPSMNTSVIPTRGLNGGAALAFTNMK
jgi:hypothetical protein